MTGDFRSLPPDLPVPLDDGAADHLTGMAMPANALASSLGGTIDLAAAARADGRLVLYIYPRTGVPGEAMPEGWNAIPGARGCTPQSCAFRDHRAELARLGASVIGLSAQSAPEQAEFAAREHIPYPVLADPELLLAEALRLPTFDVAGMRLYKRLTIVAAAGVIEHVFYPVFPPDRNAADVVAWLESA
jgi:peroxiredoxin